MAAQVRGPKESADGMTGQFNALAAQGREYVGPVSATAPSPSPNTPGTQGVLILFKRSR